MKSVLMACPTFGLSPNPNEWLATFLGAMNEFCLSGFNVSTYFPYRKNIADAENDIVQAAISASVDYIFRIDDDIWGFQKGYINKLIEADKEYISGAMFISGFPYSRCAFKRTGNMPLPEVFATKQLLLSEVEGSGIQPCDLTATPFTLIKMSVYEKLLTPYYEYRKGVATDSLFCQKMLDAKIQPYVHMDVQLNHRHVTHWNRYYLYNAEARAILQSGVINRNSPFYPGLVEQFGEDGLKDLTTLKGVKIKL